MAKIKPALLLYISMAVTFLVSLVIVLWAIVSPITGNEMGYVLLNYYFVFPVTCFVCGLVAGIKNTKHGWAYIFFAALCGYLMPLPIFAGYLTDPTIAIVGLVASGIGFLIGFAVCSAKKRKAK